jgi:hypothetical protein
MKKAVILLIALITSMTITAQVKAKATVVDPKEQINKTLDAWHKDGTDATEHWDKTAFQAFAKPYFDKGKAWNFTSLERHIYLSSDKKLAWFDELLNTQMKICRGSGVLVLANGKWKIKQYVLSMTVPNDNTDQVIEIKAPIEDELILTLQEKKN